jgi:type I restriction enzyme M protein
MQSHINRITDILRRDDGISGAMHYTEQVSRILFLRFLDEYEKDAVAEGILTGKIYTPLLSTDYQRDTRAVPKSDGKLDTMNAMSGDDLKEFVNKQLFPYLKKFRDPDADFHSMKYKIGEIFVFIENRIESGHTLREILNIVDTLNFNSQEDLFALSKIYEDLLQGMGNDGGNSGEFYTPRSIIKAMVDCLDPQIGQTVYDGATGSCGFLIEMHNHLKKLAKTTQDLEWLNRDALFGNEKTPIAYIMGVMNMILHGIENPNIEKKNTLTDNIRDFEEKDGFHIIIANPPFWGKEKDQIQANFPIKTTATEMLFMQHFMKKLKTGGKASIIIPEWVLFNSNNAFQEVKKQLLEDFDVHSIISLPAGVFLPYSGVKTNILFFEKTKPTRAIRYYEVDPGRKLTKNKPITYEDMADMIAFFKTKKTGPNSWIVQVDDIRDYDISAKNPAKITEVIHKRPSEILEDITRKNSEIDATTTILTSLISKD